MIEDPRKRTTGEKALMTDEETGRAVWRMSHSPYHDKHTYYDICPWSPDGTQIVFSSVHPSHLPEPRQSVAKTDKGNIFIMTLTDLSMRWLVGECHFNTHIGCFPMWTPDGKYIIYGEEGDPHAFFIVDVATGVQRNIPGVFPRQVSHDGTRVLCQSAWRGGC